MSDYNQVTSYRDLIVWQKSMDLVDLIYRVTNTFPKSEVFALANQIQRSACSIPSNIAEGSRRGTKKDYRNFLLNSYGSGAELETQIEIAYRQNYCNKSDINQINTLLLEIMKMLNSMIRKMDQ